MTIHKAALRLNGFTGFFVGVEAHPRWEAAGAPQAKMQPGSGAGPCSCHFGPDNRRSRRVSGLSEHQLAAGNREILPLAGLSAIGGAQSRQGPAQTLRRGGWSRPRMNRRLSSLARRSRPRRANQSGGSHAVPVKLQHVHMTSANLPSRTDRSHPSSCPRMRAAFAPAAPVRSAGRHSGSSSHGTLRARSVAVSRARDTAVKAAAGALRAARPGRHAGRAVGTAPGQPASPVSA